MYQSFFEPLQEVVEISFMHTIQTRKVLHFNRLKYQRKYVRITGAFRKNPVKYLRWSFSAKIANGLEPLAIFAESSMLDLYRFLTTPLRIQET